MDHVRVLISCVVAAVASAQVGCRPAASNSRPNVATVAKPSIQRAVRPAAPRSDYVGSQVCSECHSEIVDSYFQHPMGQSSALLHEASVLEDYSDQTSYSTPDGCLYLVEQHDGQTWHHEQRRTSAGAIVYDQAVAMDLSIGSGRHGRSYAYLRGSRFFQSPISWYTGNGQGLWGMSPGYTPGAHPRFDRLLKERCLQCHVGRLNPGSVPDTWEANEPIAEAAIGCERCHGPAASHVARHRNAATFDGFDAIVNPVKLEPIRRDAVCHQCHRQSSGTILRYGRREQDFRPGDRLADVWVVLNGKNDDRKSVTQSEQMLSSKCYVGSGGQLGCISCHDPHALPTGDPATYFDAKCALCHRVGDKECALPMIDRVDKTCIGCHMARFPASDIPHTALTDHRIPRRPESAVESVVTRPVSDVFDEGEPALPDWELSRARALAIQHVSSQRIPQEVALAAEALRSLQVFLADDPEVFEMLAWLAGRGLNDFASQELAAKQTLELAPRRYAAQELLLEALLRRQAWHEAEAVCRQLIEQDAGRALYHTMLADVLSKQGRVQEGIAAAEQSLICDPTQTFVRQILIEAYRQSGNLQRAAEHQAILANFPRRRP